MGKSKGAVELDDDLDLMDDEDDIVEEKPKKKKKKAVEEEKPAKADKSEANTYGASWLAEHVNEELGTNYTAAHIRVILRRMAKNGDLDREVGNDRARYQFTGENDRTVKAVLKRIRAGEAEEIKSERMTAARSGESGKAQKRKAKDEDAVEDKPKKAKAAEEDEAPAKPKKKATRKRDE